MGKFIRGFPGRRRTRALVKTLDLEKFGISEDGGFLPNPDPRKQHLEFAITYIHQKVQDHYGTGGTPFMKWLKLLRDETLQHRIL